MAPPPQPLPEDLIPDILLRLQPDDPAGLVRASAVCKAWRNIITDPAFHGHYRALHPRAPVLSFLHRPRKPKLPRFVSTTSFCPATADHRLNPLDCRHGRALFFDYGSLSSNGVLGCFVVWEPATGERHRLPGRTREDAMLQATVFCAAGRGCDHRGCSGGPFIVALAGLETIMDDFDDDDETTDEEEDEECLRLVDAHACFYSSETSEWDWGVHVKIHLGKGRYKLDEERPAALVGDSLYYLCWPGILRYRYGLLHYRRESDVLSMIELPRGEHLGIGKNTDMVLMEAEGGGLGLAYLCPKTRTNLYLLARETEGTVGDAWVQRRVINLRTQLPVGNPADRKRKPCFSGVSQEANVIFIRTEDGIFSIDLGGSSLQARKVCEMGVVDHWMHPFVSFYTESLLLKLASSKLPAPVGNP